MNPFFPGAWTSHWRRQKDTPERPAGVGFDRSDIRATVGTLGTVLGTVALAGDQISVQNGTALEWASKAVEAAIVVVSARLAIREMLAVSS